MNCPVTITNITTACGSNMAGVSDVWIANHGAASFTYAYQTDGSGNQILDADGKPIKASVIAASLTGTEQYKHFGFRKQTASMTSTLQVNDNGTNFWQTDVNLVFGKLDTAKRLAIMSLMQGQTSAIVRDNNGNYWLVGDSNYLTMSEGTAETGTAYSDNNAYTITLQDTDTILPLPIVESVVNAIIDNSTASTYVVAFGAGVASAVDADSNPVTDNSTVAAGTVVTFTASSGSAYQWSLNGIEVAGETSQTFTVTVNGMTYASCAVTA